MSFFLGLLAIAFGASLVKFREQWADIFGEPSWAGKVGGMQIVVVGFGILLCFWGLATITGTSDIFFGPIIHFLPGMRQAPGVEGL